VLDEPTATFKWLSERPRILAPLMAFVLVAFVSAFGTPAEVLHEMARQQAASLRERAPERFAEEDLQQMIDEAATPSQRAIIAAAQVATTLVLFTATALVLMLVFGSMAPEPIRFKDEFAIVLHAYIPQLAGAVLIVALMRFAGFEHLRLSLGFLFDPESSPFLFRLGSHIQFFGVWNVYLLAVGNQVRVGSTGIAGPLAVVSGLWILVGIAFAALASSFGGGAG
jgi:hypothetical protein